MAPVHRFTKENCSSHLPRIPKMLQASLGRLPYNKGFVGDLRTLDYSLVPLCSPASCVLYSAGKGSPYRCKRKANGWRCRVIRNVVINMWDLLLNNYTDCCTEPLLVYWGTVLVPTYVELGLVNIKAYYARSTGGADAPALEALLRNLLHAAQEAWVFSGLPLQLNDALSNKCGVCKMRDLYGRSEASKLLTSLIKEAPTNKRQKPRLSRKRKVVRLCDQVVNPRDAMRKRVEAYRAQKLKKQQRELQKSLSDKEKEAANEITKPPQTPIRKLLRRAVSCRNSVAQASSS